MKIALFENNCNSLIDAHMRNSIEIANYLNADLLNSDIDYKNALNKKYDICILVYLSPYAPIKNMLSILENSLPRKFWIKNEYDLRPNDFCYQYGNYDVISNHICNWKSQKNFNKWYVLNLNLLLAKLPNKLTQKKYDCIYYGTFRKDRTKYFKEYLQNDIYVSTSSKNFKKYKHIGANPKYINKLNWSENKETLNNFRYSLYIEDEYTHKVFNNLANRWYEAGFCNNVMFFDINCINTIRKSEIAKYENEIQFYIVSNYKELQEKIKECNKDFEYHLNIQKSWHSNELQLKNNMLEELKNIIYNKA